MIMEERLNYLCIEAVQHESREDPPIHVISDPPTIIALSHQIMHCLEGNAFLNHQFHRLFSHLMTRQLLTIIFHEG